ncbi:hypothetical protein ACOY7K_23905, partial [Enterobacter asburiae]
GTVCVVGKIRDLILQLSKSSIYSTKPLCACLTPGDRVKETQQLNISFGVFLGLHHYITAELLVFLFLTMLAPSTLAHHTCMKVSIQL